MSKYKEEEHAVTRKFGWRHVQVLLLFLGMATGYSLRTCMSVAVVAMRNKSSANPNFKEYPWTASESLLIQSSFFWGYILSMVPSGFVVNFWNAHKLMAFGMFFSSVFHSLTSFLADYGLLVVILNRFTVGLFQGCLLPCVHTLLSRWVPPLERSRLGSFVMNGPQFGTVVAMPVTGALAASSFGWPSTFYLFGFVGIIWSVVFLFMGADSPSRHSKIKTKEQLYIDNSMGNLVYGKKVQVPWKSILMSLPVWALLIVHSGFNWGFYTLLTVTPTYMKSVLEFDISKSGLVSAYPYLAMWLLGFPIGYFSDWALGRGVSTAVVRKISNTIGLWIPALALIIFCVITTTDTTILVAILTLGVGFISGNTAGFQINHIDLSPNFAGVLMSITNAVANVMGIVAQLFSMVILTKEDDMDQWHIVFYVTAAIYFFSNLIFVLFGKAEVQPWNSSGDVSEYRKRPARVSIISITGEPTTLYLPEKIEEEDTIHTPC